MKKQSISTGRTPFIASLAAFVLLTANAVAASAVIAAGGIAAILLIDYGRAAAPLVDRADVIAYESAAPGTTDEREAA